MQPSPCNSFKDQALVDDIYGCVNFKWAEVTWFALLVLDWDKMIEKISMPNHYMGHGQHPYLKMDVMMSTAVNMLENRAGALVTNGFLPAIQIWWKLHLAVIPLLAIRSRQILAHARTAQLSCHVQNFVAITLLDSRWEWNDISIGFEMRWKKRLWNGAQ